MNIKEEIKEQLNRGPLLLDGAMGTMLQAHGLKSGECSEEWNISHSQVCLLYTSPSPRDLSTSRMPSSA